MAESGILKKIIPHTDDWRVLARLPEDAVLRLFVLAQNPLTLKQTLRLSNAQDQRLMRLGEAPQLSPALSVAEQKRILYRLGAEVWRDAVHLSFAQSRAPRGADDWQLLLDLPGLWQAPPFPLTGADLIGAGFAAGPRLGQTLAALEDWWLASDFVPVKGDLLQRSMRYKES